LAYLLKKEKMRRAHRYNHIPLLHFCPGGVLQELIARRAAKVAQYWPNKKALPDKNLDSKIWL
jgi:hypothetical protein